MNINYQQRASILLSGIMLFMVLSRLVWMQVRTYKLQPSLSFYSAFLLSTNVLSPDCREFGQVEPIFKNSQAQQFFANLSENRAPLARFLVEPLTSQLAKLFCSSSSLVSLVIKIHWSFVIAILLLCVFLTRFLARSWFLAIFVAATLMSRGAFLAQIGMLAEDLPLSLCLTASMTLFVHYLKSLAKGPLLLLISINIFAASFDSVFSYFGLALLLAVWLVKPKKESDTGREECEAFAAKPCLDQIGGWFRPAQYNLSTKMRSPTTRRRWVATAITSIISLTFARGAYRIWPLFSEDSKSFLIGLLAKMIDADHFMTYTSHWMRANWNFLDLHYIASIVFIVIPYLRRGLIRKHNTQFVAAKLMVLLMGGLAVYSFFDGFIDFSALTSVQHLSDENSLVPMLGLTSYLVWLEPIVLTLGIIGLFQMLTKGTRS